jgi:hypothetical protein
MDGIGVVLGTGIWILAPMSETVSKPAMIGEATSKTNQPTTFIIRTIGTDLENPFGTPDRISSTIHVHRNHLGDHPFSDTDLNRIHVHEHHLGSHF